HAGHSATIQDAYAEDFSRLLRLGWNAKSQEQGAQSNADKFSVASSVISHACLPNHLVRSQQHTRRNRETDLLGGSQIDHEFKFSWLLHWQIAGFGSLQDFVDVHGGPMIKFGKPRAV